MKKLILALAVLAFIGIVDTPAPAQTVFKPLTPTMNMAFTNTVSKAITANFTSQTQYVRLVCTVACFVQSDISGTSPVAVASGATSSLYLPAAVPMMLKVERSGKMAVIGLSATGVLYIQEMGQ